MNQNPFAIQKTGWTGTAIDFSGTVYTTLPVYASDGVTVVTPGVPEDISLWVFMLTIKANDAETDAEAVYEFDWKIAADAGASGAFNTSWPAVKTVSVPAGTYLWEIKAIPGGVGDPIMFTAGNLAIRQSVGDRIVPVLTP